MSNWEEGIQETKYPENILLKLAPAPQQPVLDGIFDVTWANIQGVMYHHAYQSQLYYAKLRKFMNWARFWEELIEHGISFNTEYNELLIEWLLQFLSVSHGVTMPVPKVIDDAYHFLIVNEQIWHNLQTQVFGFRMEHRPIASHEYFWYSESSCPWLTITNQDIDNFIRSIYWDSTSELFWYSSDAILYIEARLAMKKAERIMTTLESQRKENPS